MTYEPPTVPCALCGAATPMLGTKRCDWCYYLETGIRRAPELSAKILADMSKPAAGEKPLRTVLVVTAELEAALAELRDAVEAKERITRLHRAGRRILALLPT